MSVKNLLHQLIYVNHGKRKLSNVNIYKDVNKLISENLVDWDLFKELFSADLIKHQWLFKHKSLHYNLKMHEFRS